METRVALIGIIVTQESSVAALNELLRRPSLPSDYLALDPALPRLRALLGL